MSSKFHSYIKSRRLEDRPPMRIIYIGGYHILEIDCETIQRLSIIQPKIEKSKKLKIPTVT